MANGVGAVHVGLVRLRGDGDVVSWTCVLHDTPDKTYQYVALFGGNRWHLTGRSGRLTTYELTELIAGLALRGTVESPDFGDL